MLTDYEREIATVLVEALVEYGLLEHLAEDEYQSWFRSTKLRELGFGSASGLTKICIWHEDLMDWVVKVGYTTFDCDYATLEYNNYCLAEEDGLAHYFPNTICIGEYGGRHFYLQEWADCDEYVISSDWIKRLRDRYEEDGIELDEEELRDEVIGLDDSEKVYLCFHDSNLCDFINRLRINDLHEGNFGYVGGSMVIIDFSGWHN